MTEIKAVVGAAGFGSRLLPVTAAVSKSLLPVGARPVIDYILAELVAAGVRDVAVVTMPGDDGIRRYVDPPAWIEHYFDVRGWTDKYAPVAQLRERLAGLRFTWIEQPLDGRYGTAIPPLLARDFIGDSDWLLLSGDDVVLREDGGSDLANMVAACQAAGLPAAMQVANVPRDSVSRYEIVRTRSLGDGEHLTVFDGVVEKPSPDASVGTLANISRYFLPADFVRYLDAVQPDPRTNEYQSITALAEFARTSPVLIHTVSGVYHDCGSADGLLTANEHAATLSQRVS